jgi:poly-gamma-glutamate synthesis protein (capsule biosynthesis protein)
MPERADGNAFTVAAAGDAIQMRPLSVLEDPGVEKLAEYVRSADASFVNIEQVIGEYDDGYPTGLGGGGGLVAPPEIADDLDWAGFNLFGVANNHSNDLLHGGMFATMRELDQRSLVYAGLGENLGEARSPAMLDTTAGRVALVAAAAAPPPGSAAGKQRPDFPGRPGLNPIRVDSRYVVPDEHFEYVQRLSEDLGLEALRERRLEKDILPVPQGGSDDEFAFMTAYSEPGTGVGPVWFERGEEASVELQPNEADVEAYVDAIRSASEHSDWVLASLHIHEGPGGKMNHWAPEFCEELARECIDAGAHAFIGHGPHQLRGIEVYDERPIFYSLNSWAQQLGAMERLPQEHYERFGLGTDALPGDYYAAGTPTDAGEDDHGRFPDPTFWEAILPVFDYDEDGRLLDLEVVPIDLQQDAPVHETGTPTLAEGDTARTILDNVCDYSEPYDTEIRFDDGVGVVEL